MDSGVVAYQMTISHLPLFFGGGVEGIIYRKSKQQCIYLECIRRRLATRVFSILLLTPRYRETEPFACMYSDVCVCV